MFRWICGTNGQRHCSRQVLILRRPARSRPRVVAVLPSPAQDLLFERIQALTAFVAADRA
jgi:hypothetical protein